MNKKYIIQMSKEIENIVKTGTKKVSKYFIIYNKDDVNEYNRYCISVSKKLGHAYLRNKLKRRTKDILMKNKIDLHKKYVIILRKEAINASYDELKNILLHQIKGDMNEK